MPGGSPAAAAAARYVDDIGESLKPSSVQRKLAAIRKVPGTTCTDTAPVAKKDLDDKINASASGAIPTYNGGNHGQL